MGLDICHVRLCLKTDDALEFFTIEEFSNNPSFLEKHRHLITSVFDEKGSLTSVIYYEDVGYQRKQVKDNFIYQFENDKLYFDLDEVRSVRQFLKAEKTEDQSELEDSFQRNFIDNFIEGESIFFISW